MSEQTPDGPVDGQPAVPPSTWPAAPVPPPGSAVPPPPPGAAVPPPGGPVAPTGYPQAPGSAVPGYPAPGYAAPGYPAPAGEQRGTSTNAIIAFVLSITSWVVCPIVPAIVALVLASMATKEIAASGGRLNGRGLNTAAKIISWVNLGLWAAGLIIFLFILLIAAISQ